MSSTIEREISKIIADILQVELGLDDEHCILGDQKFEIPKDEKLFVVVFDDSIKYIGNTKFLETDEESVNAGQEVQQASGLHSIRIEIMSFGKEARVRKEEIIMALNSFTSDQVQEKSLIQISRAQSPVNATAAEETENLFRYVVLVNVTALHQKVKKLPQFGFYDKFNGATEDQTINQPEVNTNE